MDRPGIEVRPILQMDGESKFNEVFLDNVIVERGDLLGEVDRGWAVAMSILGRERRMLGSLAIGLSTSLTDLRTYAERLGVDDLPFQRRWAELWGAACSSCGGPGSVCCRRNLAGHPHPIDGGMRKKPRMPPSRPTTIAGGTSEVQRNILGERVLGLPR